jgi:hypothetical protein
MALGGKVTAAAPQAAAEGPVSKTAGAKDAGGAAMPKGVWGSHRKIWAQELTTQEKLCTKADP